MIAFLQTSTYFGVLFSLAAYFVGLWIQKRLKHPIFNALLIAYIIVIGSLVLFHIDYESYQKSAEPLSYLLTPATVCLAIPLYQQLDKLKRHWQAVLCGIVSGVVGAMASIWLMSMLFGLSHQAYVSMLPKSVTTAIGMGLS